MPVALRFASVDQKCWSTWQTRSHRHRPVLSLRRSRAGPAIERTGQAGKIGLHRGVLSLLLVLAVLLTVHTGRAQTAAGSWIAVAPMPTMRVDLAAATGKDHRVYAIGGENDVDGNPGGVDAYDPGTNTWHSAASLPTPRGYLAAATGLDGRIYAIGGLKDFSDVVGTVEAYNPATNAWSTVAPMPIARSNIAAATGKDGRIYVFGGSGDLDSSSPGATFTAVESYDPASNTWRRAAPMPTPRYDIAAATGKDGRIYVLGGTSGTVGDGAALALNTVEAYDPATNTWSARAPMPTARYGLAAVSGPDGRIYAIGGCCTAGGAYVSTVEAYDPTSNTWTTAAPLPISLLYLAAATASNGRIYALGGINEADVTVNTVEAYTPPTSSTTGPGGAPPGPTPSPSKVPTATATRVPTTPPATSTATRTPTPAKRPAPSTTSTLPVPTDTATPVATARPASIPSATPTQHPPAIMPAGTVPPTSTIAATSVAAAAPSPTPTLAPGGTVTPTSTPASAAPPTATATARPLKVRLKIAKKYIKAGQQQRLAVVAASGARAGIRVIFPNRATLRHRGTVGASRTLVWRFREPKGTARGRNRMVNVVVTIQDAGGRTASLSGKYTTG